MKIAFIAIKGIPFSGGIEKYTDELAEQLTNKGHSVTVYTTKNYGNRTGCYNNIYNIVALPAPRNKYLEKISVVFLASLHQIFCDYDIVHYHALGPSILAFMARLSGKKVVIQSHGIEYKRAKWNKIAAFLLKLMEKASYNMGNELTVVSKTLRDYFKGKYGKDAVYIPTAVDIADRIPLDQADGFGVEQSGYYLFMARIVPEKGLHYLIPAYKKSAVTRKLVIAGRIVESDPYQSKMVDMAADNEGIIFTGEISGRRKAQFLSNAYAFVLPSEMEGLSVALLEAMSYKRCCVVSDIAENLEVAEGRSITFESRSINSLTKALNYADTHPDEVDQYGKLSYEYILENHQINQIANGIEELYENMVQKKFRYRRDKVDASSLFGEK